MLIYCNGDSFTSGHGLGDFVLPGYPGDQETSPPARSVTCLWVERWVKESYRNGSRKSMQEEVVKEEQARCWPTKLGQYGYEIINSSQAGASMTRVARTTITDLIQLKKTRDDVIAIICPAFFLRSEIYYDRTWWSINPAMAETYDAPQMREYCRLVLENDSEYQTILKWYLAAIQIKDHCKCNNIPLIWIDSHNEYPTGNSAESSPDISLLHEYASIKYSASMRSISINGLCGKSYAADGHFSAEIHTALAHLLNNIIKEVYGKGAYNR